MQGPAAHLELLDPARAVLVLEDELGACVLHHQVGAWPHICACGHEDMAVTRCFRRKAHDMHEKTMQPSCFSMKGG
jgi:hypothetical protein